MLSRLCIAAHRFAKGCSRQIHNTSTATESNGDNLLVHWRDMLQQADRRPVQNAQPLWESGALQQLLQAALRVHSREAVGRVLPDEATSIFMQAYQRLSSDHQRLAFFSLLSQEFGVQRACLFASALSE